MPTLESTKRKFHKLLDNLTSSPVHPSSLSTTTTIDEPSAKRARLTTTSNPTPPGSSSLSTRSTPSLREAARLLRQRKAAQQAAAALAASASKAPEDLPNYNPWSHPAFLARLATFANVIHWTSKPDPVNEVAWARRGWTLCTGPGVDKDTVACKGCGRRVVVNLQGRRPPERDKDGQDDEEEEEEEEEEEDAAVEAELVRRFVELVVEGHDEGCLWRENGCAEDIHRLSIARPAVWQPQLRARYASFVRAEIGVPALERVRCPVDLAGLERSLPVGFLAREGDDRGAGCGANGQTDGAASEKPAGVNRTALAFALLGWSVSAQASAPAYVTARCGACFRRLPLWLYNGTSDAMPSSQPNDASARGQDDEQEDDQEDRATKLDLVQNHRHYCPWIDPAAQAMPGSFAGLAAWEVLCKVVKNSAGLRAARLSGGSSTAGSKGEMDRALREGQDGATAGEGESPARVRTTEEVEMENKARFKRLRELTRGMGLKRLKK